MREADRAVPVRDWLCDALVLMATRDARRVAAVEVRRNLRRSSILPDDPVAADKLVDAEIRERVRPSGRTNNSRAVSELVRVGLVKRHCMDYRVDQHNRGVQRKAVCTIAPEARRALGRA